MIIPILSKSLQETAIFDVYTYNKGHNTVVTLLNFE